MTFGLAEYTIDRPNYNNATVDVVAYNTFKIEIQSLHVSIESPFDYEPKNEPKYSGTVQIDM